MRINREIGGIVLQFDKTVTQRHVSIMNDVAKYKNIIRRSVWGAMPPTSPLVPDWGYDSIVVHYTGHNNLTTPHAIQGYDIEHDHFDDIAYHYIIEPGGLVYEGRELIYKGSHTYQQNTGKIGIVCVGDYDSGFLSLLRGHGFSGDPIRHPMIDSLRDLTKYLNIFFAIRTFGGHKEYGFSATCPGDQLLPIVQSIRQEFGFSAPVYRAFK
jgi:hypothetical protein